MQRILVLRYFKGGIRVYIGARDYSVKLGNDTTFNAVSVEPAWIRSVTSYESEEELEGTSELPFVK